MRTRIGLVLMFSLLLVLALPGFASAKGPASRITIVGPGLNGELVLEGDATVLTPISFAMLEDFMQPVDPPARPARGFELTRFFETNSGEFVPFDQVAYHPAPDGEPGVVHYLGIVNGSSEYDGRWFRTSSKGEAALREVLASHGANLDAVAVPVAPYLALTGERGALRLFDPATLDTAAAWQISASEPSLIGATGAPLGDALFLNALDEHGEFGTLRLDLASARACPLELPGEVIAAAPDGENVIVSAQHVKASEHAPTTRLEVRRADTLDFGKITAVAPGSAAVQHFASQDGRQIATLRHEDDNTSISVFDTLRQQTIVERRVGKMREGAAYRIAWDSASGAIYVLDGQWVYRLDGDELEFTQYGGFELVDEDKQPLGVPGAAFEIAGARDGTLYLYRPGEVGGILQVRFVLGRLEERLWADLAPVQAVLHGETIYVVTHDADTDESALWALDLATGARESAPLEPGDWRLNLVWLDPAAAPSEGGEIIRAGCG